MTPDEALTAPIAGVAAAIRAGRLSSADLVARCLENIEARDGTLQSFVHVAHDALDQGRRADEAARSGTGTGPLAGIPIAVKDNYLTADMPTTAGTAAQIAFRQEDGAAIAKLRAAGAILIGKTRMHEFAWGMETPPTRNPYDESRVPGGSSGGSGAAVTAGFCLAATGSDTGGSIRIPASLCGNVGFKPTFGRIGRSGIVPHSWSLDHAGPLARNVADAALLVDIMSGHDSSDDGSAEEPPTDLSAALTRDAKGLRVGVCRNHFFEALDPQVERAVEATIALLGRLGATIVEFEVPELEYGLGAIFAIELSSSTAYHLPHLSAGRVDTYAQDVRLLVEMGRLVTGSDYLQAERYRALLGRKFQQVFNEVDVVVGPTMPITAWEIGQKDVVLGGRTEVVLETSWRFTYPWNLLGLPAITVPCGFDDKGLPIGFQIAGAAFDEPSVVRTASLVERHAAG